MSMRATFTTEFIYDGAEGCDERYRKLCDVLEAEKETKKRNMVGQIFGIIKGLDLAEEDIRRWVLEMCYELSKITIVPFKIVWLLEGGDVLIKQIEPSYPPPSGKEV